jgi:hypothetical protein
LSKQYAGGGFVLLAHKRYARSYQKIIQSFGSERGTNKFCTEQSAGIIGWPLAKARVWASDGWNVTIVVRDENALGLVEEFPLIVSNLQGSGLVRFEQ